MERISLITLILIFSVVSICLGEDLDQLASLIRNNDLAYISSQMKSGRPMQWPEIASQSIEKNQQKIELAEAFLEKIINVNGADPQTAIPVLNRIAEKLYACGGYSNYVLADSAQRLAIASLLKALIAGNLSPEKGEMLSGSLSSAFPPTDAWIKILNREMPDNYKANILNDTRTEKYLKELYALTGNDSEDSIYVRIGSNSATSTNLLQRRDIAVLARRMAETETYRIAHLRALIFFMNNGGKPQDIDLNDIRNLSVIFSKTREVFASPLLKISRINAVHLKMLIEDLSSGEAPRILLGYE